MSELKSFTLSYTSLKTLPQRIPWPKTLRNIDLSYNDKLESIEEFSIRSASGLENLGLLGSPPSIALKQNSLFTESQLAKLWLNFYGTEGFNPGSEHESVVTVLSFSKRLLIWLRTRYMIFALRQKARFDKFERQNY